MRWVCRVRADKAERVWEGLNEKICVFNAVNIAQGAPNNGGTRNIQGEAQTHMEGKELGKTARPRGGSGVVGG